MESLMFVTFVTLNIRVELQIDIFIIQQEKRLYSKLNIDRGSLTIIVI